MIRLLIDECLSTALMSVARERGYAADHVTHIGLSGRQDWNLIPIIEAGDYLFVTNNRMDFLRLYERQALHNGLIVIVPNTHRQAQCHLFRCALEHLAQRDDLVNLGLEVEADGRVRVFDLPSGE